MARCGGSSGPNGSGKTTTIRMLCGLLHADAGEGTCLGYDVSTQSEEIKRAVGYMTQKFSFWEDLSIRENLEFVARMYQLHDGKARVDDTIARLGLEQRQTQLAGELSGGWKQRLALAACMLHSPKLLLLDEPTAGVDPKARRDFWDEIHRLSSEGLTVLVSTHYMDEAERCDRIVYINLGNIVARGTVAEVIEQSKLFTFIVEGEGARQLAEKLRGAARRRVRLVLRRGAACQRARSRRARSRARALSRTAWPRRSARRVPSLEDVFIQLQEQEREGRDERALLLRPHAARSWPRNSSRCAATGSTLGMIVGIPVMQLFLFGFAINLNPEAPADGGFDLRSRARSPIRSSRRSQNSSYFDVVKATNSPSRRAQLLDEGDVSFVVEIPANFSRDLVRGANPSLLVEVRRHRSGLGFAMPSAALDELFDDALRDDLKGPLAARALATPPFNVVVHPLYNPGGHHPVQHRAGAARR